MRTPLRWTGRLARRALPVLWSYAGAGVADGDHRPKPIECCNRSGSKGRYGIGGIG
jgi:hypothetical protein